ncbi:metallophosphoesterase [Vibrio quintilis]|uniref:Serine/threonine-protein phosphatase 1 n=1 Tax=Vibrio quintilis TaxID=1117707 RepID=A0A1M7Z2C6_9VIBR|nr:metallophosphoesterase [Vibrio quintilis]SHO58940.1 Serine/threonine-protein phosphatase 1 [Vibrio quintilis]
MSDNRTSDRIPLSIDYTDPGWVHFRSGKPAASSRLIYAVADIHGCDMLLAKMLAAIEKDRQTAPAEKPLIIFLGDYIDRGADSKRVVDLLIRSEKMDDSASYTFLLGNHEQWLLDFIHERPVLPVWGTQGGMETLLSYGVPRQLIIQGLADAEAAAEVRRVFLDKLPESHRQFYLSLKPSVEMDDYFFAHAGVDPVQALKNQSTQSLIWIRDRFLRSKMDFGKVIVHGHTPSARVESLPNRINLDSGIYFRNVLRCVVLEGTSRYLIQVE